MLIKFIYLTHTIDGGESFKLNIVNMVLLYIAVFALINFIVMLLHKT